MLQVQVQARAASDAIAGVLGDRLKVRLTAPPVEGRANEHLMTYLAKVFGIPRSQVVLERGKTAKHKQVRLRSPRKLPEYLDWDQRKFPHRRCSPPLCQRVPAGNSSLGGG